MRRRIRVAFPGMWQAVAAIAVGLIGLGGVVLGQHMSREVALDSHRLQLEEQRRLEVRRILVRLIVDMRAQLDHSWILLPMMMRFEETDWHEWVETDSGKANGQRAQRIREDIVALGLLVPDGPLRAALSVLEVEAVRDWPEKAVGPVTNRQPPPHGRDRIDVAFEHVRLCTRALNDVQREASSYLATSHIPPSKRKRLALRRG